MKIYFIIIFIFLISLPAFGKAGGATSGGGHLLGIDAARVADHVFMSIDIIGPRLYQKEELKVIQKIKNELKIIMINSNLPVEVKDVVQNGSAFSVHNDQSSTMFLIEKDWNNIKTLLEREAFIHHEIMVLAGLEETGDYHLSVEFEKLRKKFWQLSESKKVICVINVFEIGDYYGEAIPGKLIGSSSSSVNFLGASGGMGILAKLDNGNALIWRGVISSDGYFRMEIDEAEYYKKSFFEKKRDTPDPLSVNLGTITIKEREKVYFDPYKIEKPEANPIVFGENYAIVVNCTQF